MQYAKLGRTGLSVSRICLGCMSYGDKKWRDWVLTVEDAREHFAEAGLTQWIDLREGDLRETLEGIEGPIDFVLMDIWTEIARPALERVCPVLRAGAIVLADNTTAFRQGYDDYFAFVNHPKNGLRTLTMPYPGGLELTVRT